MKDAICTPYDPSEFAKGQKCDDIKNDRKNILAYSTNFVFVTSMVKAMHRKALTLCTLLRLSNGRTKDCSASFRSCSINGDIPSLSIEKMLLNDVHSAPVWRIQTVPASCY